jgi:hypothetical protein
MRTGADLEPATVSPLYRLPLVTILTVFRSWTPAYGAT